MRQLLGLLLLTVPFAVGAAPEKQWLEPVPAGLGYWRDWQSLGDTSFFEVPASRLAAAESWLSTKPYAPGEVNTASYFRQPEFKCTAPDQLYLIRALYVNGGTGGFRLYWTKENALVVSHFSLGRGNTVEQSALVACLPSAPTAVYSSISGAL